jgi:hypothetical protein
MSDVSIALERDQISRCEKLIRPYVRCTPIIKIDGADVGVNSRSLSLELELFQHTGSFKARRAFANLLLRKVPAAGVVSASGGNHGAAVAFAAMTLKVPAKIFVPSVSSPAKVARIREYGADLVIEGDRYADALAAREAWVERSGAIPVHAFDQYETMLGQGTVGQELTEQAPDNRYAPCVRWRRRSYRWNCGLVCRRHQGHRRRAIRLADAYQGVGGWTTGGRRSGRSSRGLASAQRVGERVFLDRQILCTRYGACDG